MSEPLQQDEQYLKGYADGQEAAWRILIDAWEKAKAQEQTPPPSEE